MAKLRDLGGEAARLLELFVEQLTALEVAVPETRYVSPGSIPAWDGEQLTVNILRVEQGQPGVPQGGTMFRAVFFATFGISIIREVPALYGDGQPGVAMIPNPADLQVAGSASFDDAAALILAATAIHESYVYGDPQEGFEIGPVTSLGPQGGLAGQQIQLAITVS